METQVNALQAFSHLGERDHSLFRTLIKTTVDGVMVTDEAGFLQIYNEACARLFQYPPEEVLGADVRMLIPPHFRPVFERCVQRSAQDVRPGEIWFEHEMQGLRRDGSLFPMLLSVGEGRLDGNRVFLAVIQDLTTLHRERIAHDEEKAYLALIIESSDDAIISHMLDGTVRSWNHAAEIMFGYRADEIVGASFPSLMPLFVPEDIIDAEREYFNHVLTGVKVPPRETVRYHKDGTPVQVRITATPIRDASGTIVGIARTVRDIRDRKAHEKERALLSAIVDSSSEAIISYDLSGAITSFNRAAEAMYGYSAEEVIGMNVLDTVSLVGTPQQRDEEREILERLLRGETVPPYERQRRRKDGTPLHALISVSTIRDPAGKIIGTSRIVRDISERKAYEQQRALLSSIIETSNDAIYTKTLDSIVTSWNAAAEAMFGYKASEIVGKSMKMLVPPDRTEEEAEVLKRTSAGETIRHYETVRLRKDGSSIDVSVTISPLRDAAGTIVGASNTIRDIAERKAYEARLQSMREDMIHVARVQELSQVSAGIAHELNQPLAAMMNYSNVARRLVTHNDPVAVEKLPDVVGKLGEQAERAGQIIRRMRDFVEKRTPHRAVEDINAIADDAVALGLIGSKAANIETRFVHEPDAPPVFADRVQIQQVLVNLLRNAAEAMAETPRRELTLSIRKAERDLVEVAVADTGAGIPEHVAARLFTPFVTTKANGMGIGLAISKSIIEAHGGELTVNPNPGGGTVFRFTLPAAA